MAEVIKTVENVDKLFSQIVVNGEVYESERYVETEATNTSKPKTTTASETESTETKSSATESTARATTQGEDVYCVELNDVLHNFVDQAVTQGLADEVATRQSADNALSQGIADEVATRQSADNALSQDIADEVTARQSADQTLQTSISSVEALIPSTASAQNQLADTESVGQSITTAVNELDVPSAGGNGKYIKAISETDGKISATEGTIDNQVSAGSSNPVTSEAVAEAISSVQASVSDIEALIPNQATSQNQLADKDFVNSSIATNTANFLGTYTSLADIEAIQNPTNNDYVFLQTTDQAGNTVFDRYKYSASQSQWLFEYELNNSSFTAEQWATINSGITSSSITDAINALDVASAGGNGKYIKAISETNGKISATEGTIDSSISSGSSNPVTGGAVYTALSGKKDTQTAKSSPSASGNAYQFIDTITQDANGEITATKKSVRSASTSQTGIVQLSNSYSGSSSSKAVTEKALSDGLASIGVNRTWITLGMTYTYPASGTQAMVTLPTPSGFTITSGTVLELFFPNAFEYTPSTYNYGSSVKLSCGGCTGYLQYKSAVGSWYSAQSFDIRDSAGNKSKYMFWQANTRMTVLWDGAEWLVLDNPLLYLSVDRDVTKHIELHADGFVHATMYASVARTLAKNSGLSTIIYLPILSERDNFSSSYQTITVTPRCSSGGTLVAWSYNNSNQAQTANKIYVWTQNTGSEVSNSVGVVVSLIYSGIYNTEVG